MDALAAYGSSDESDGGAQSPQNASQSQAKSTTKSAGKNSAEIPTGIASERALINAAPDVVVAADDFDGDGDQDGHGLYVQRGTKAMAWNLPLADLARPVQGAQHPHQRPMDRAKNTHSGTRVDPD